MDRRARQRQRELRAVYEQGWGILSAWATCECPEGRCPLEAELDRLMVRPGDLLAAMATGQPEFIGLDRRTLLW
jgi:hypothetical protein